jgi:hypothetical protein
VPAVSVREANNDQCEIQLSNLHPLFPAAHYASPDDGMNDAPLGAREADHPVVLGGRSRTGAARPCLGGLDRAVLALLSGSSDMGSARFDWRLDQRRRVTHIPARKTNGTAL